MSRIAGLAAQDRASHRSAPISILIRRKLQYGFLAAIAALTLGAVSLASPATAAVNWSSASSAAWGPALRLDGQVRSGTPLDVPGGDSSIIVPQGLPVVAHATVSIPQLFLSTTTNSAGNFTLSVPAASAHSAITVKVTAAGFGTWRESGIELSPAGPANIYVQLQHSAQFLASGGRYGNLTTDQLRAKPTADPRAVCLRRQARRLCSLRA
jgi:hypothetical protein